MFRQVCKVRPNDKDARTKYTQCKKIVQEQAFARAIAVESKTKSVCDDLNLDTMGKLLLQCYIFNSDFRPIVSVLFTF